LLVAFLLTTYYRGHDSFVAGHQDGFHHNVCIMQSDGTYAKMDCTRVLPDMHDNRVYVPGSAESIPQCGMTLSQWQALGHDANTTLGPIPPSDQVLGWAREALGLP